jgi:hypothetical protein
MCKPVVAGLTGLEPATFRVTGGRSSQTELQPQTYLAKLIPQRGTGLQPQSVLFSS